MYRTDFWTLWEKARVGCFERTVCILSIVKQITSPGWMHETSARAWCIGKTQRNRVEREVGGGSGWGLHVTPWLIHVNVWQNPLQCCEVISLQLIKINEKKRKKINSKNTIYKIKHYNHFNFFPSVLWQRSLLIHKASHKYNFYLLEHKIMFSY